MVKIAIHFLNTGEYRDVFLLSWGLVQMKKKIISLN